MQELSSVMGHDDESVKQFEADHRHDEELAGGDVFSVVAAESLPVLRRRSAPSDHILCDCRLRDVGSEQFQFTMNARRAPERVSNAHFTDQIPNFLRYFRSAAARS